MKNKLLKFFKTFVTFIVTLVMVACTTPTPPKELDKTGTITLAEAISIAEQTGTTQTSEKYTVIGTITEVSNTTYGNMVISDGTNELTVYGMYNSDGSKRYDEMDYQPVAGDEIKITGPLMNYKNSKPEMVDAWLLDYIKGSEKEDDFTLPAAGTKVSIEDAIKIAKKVGETPTDRWIVEGEVKYIDNAKYGAMYITDGTNDLYIYGSYSKDGTVPYAQMDEVPYQGDTVVLSCLLNYFNGVPQAKSAWIQSFTRGQSDLVIEDYTVSTVAGSREAQDGDKVLVEGVVAFITYTQSWKENGFYLVDNTGSIFVYDTQIVARVDVGNKIKIAATKDYYVAEDEQSSASKFGYKGCGQLTNVYLVSNDEGNNQFDLTWVEESTVKEIMDTPYSENITANIYKVNAFVKKQVNPSFVNYYIDDLDGITGSYVYTSNNGSDFAWLDEFDGEICTVYLSPLNAKSTASGCIWRFIPIKVIDENYEFDQNKGAQFVLDYYVKDQFEAKYNSNPALEVVTKVSNDEIDIYDATVNYTSSDENVVKFETVENKLVMNLVNYGTANITVEVSYYGNTASYTQEIKYVDPGQIEALTVLEAINTADNTEVQVKGIVGASMANKVGFYLIDETGAIAVSMSTDELSKVELGQEVVIKGKKTHYYKDSDSSYAGQVNIYEATLVLNLYGEHSYSTSSFDTTKTLSDLADYTINDDCTAKVYTVSAKIILSTYSVSIQDPNNSDKYITLYHKSVNEYSFLHKYANQTLTMDVAICNWNKKHRVCVLAVYVNGERIVNDIHF